MLTIYPLVAFADNYIWVLVDESRKEAIVVDPGDEIPVLAFLAEHALTLTTILITHKHHDHIGGISGLLAIFPLASVFSSSIEKVPKTTHRVADRDIIALNDFFFQVMAIPGHTLEHIAYYCKPFLFCGDTLFTNGCGRIFEGTAEQMLLSLKKLRRLADDTQIYCGHEYTLSNMLFAVNVEPSNRALQNRFEKVKQLRLQNLPTVPSTLGLEKATNPFLRCSESSVVKAVSSYAGKPLHSEQDVFSHLREWKNNF